MITACSCDSRDLLDQVSHRMTRFADAGDLPSSDLHGRLFKRWGPKTGALEQIVGNLSTGDNLSDDSRADV